MTNAFRRTTLTLVVVAAAALGAGSAHAATNTIFTIAGTGEPGFTGDGGPALLATMQVPWGVTVSPDGAVFLTDTQNNRIRKVQATGTITTVAGSTKDGEDGAFSGDGGPATAAELHHPYGIASAPDGSLIVADRENQRIRRVAPDGTITTVAGSGRPTDPSQPIAGGFSGDGGPATKAQLRSPMGVAVASDGSILIADTGNQRIRRVAPDGTISTVAGTGTTIDDSSPLTWFEGAFSGDGGPATAARLSSPTGVAAAPGGGILIADFRNGRIRRVDPGGTITTVAGTGTAGFAGDGGPAARADLNLPAGVTAAPDGSVLIADRTNNRIRRITVSGRITTFAGGGNDPGGTGFSGDGGPATSATLNSPSSVAVAPDGTLVVADTLNYRIRRVDADLRALPPGTAGPAGPAGSPGPPGSAGVPGPPVVAVSTGASPLAVALAGTALRAPRGSTMTLRFASTTRAQVTVTLRRGSARPVIAATATAQPGRNTVSLRAPRAPGRYLLTITATTGSATTTDTATLTVARRR